jgi:PKD repeat protein
MNTPLSPLQDSDSFTDDETGQLLLVGAVVIVVSLVAVTLVLNTVLYTANIEARETSPESELAAEYIDTLQSEYSTALHHQNQANYTSEATAHQNTISALHDVNNLMAKQFAESQGVYATIDSVQTTNGTVIRHTDTSCTFESAKADCGSTSSNSDPVADYEFSPSSPEAGEDVQFDGGYSSDSDGSISSYEWDFDNDGDIDATGATPVASFTYAGEYPVTLIVTDDDGETDTYTERIVVETNDSNKIPDTDFTYSPSNPRPNEQITFNASIAADSDGSITSYDWDLNDDGTYDASGEEVTFTYSETGDKSVTLTVTDDNGDTNTITKQVTVAKNTPDSNNPPFSVEASHGAVSTTDWTLVETSRLRKFQFQVDDGDLATSIDSSLLTDESTLRSNAFTVLVTGENGNEWRVYLYESEPGEIIVSTQQNDGSINIQYQKDVSSATIDITTGTVNGENVGFSFAPNVDGMYTVSFRNGDAAQGQYFLVVPDTPSESTTIHSDNFHSVDESQSPYTASGIYSAQVRATFDVDTLSYASTIRIAPNEPLTLKP